MKLILGLMILSGALSHNAFAMEEGTFNKRSDEKKCGDVDLRGPKLGPVRNQDTVGWCFGYTAADLVSYRLGKKVSGLDISMNFYDKMKEQPRDGIMSQLGGGSDMGAISLASNEFCPEESLPSDDDVFPKECGATGGYQIVQFIQSIEEFRKSASAQASTCMMSGLPKIFKNMSADEIMKVVNRKDISSFQIINELRNRNCKTTKIVPSPKIKMRSGLRSGFDSLKDIDTQLNDHNPISLNYDANFLLAKKVDGIANHYSSIVGRRFNKASNSCQYLIRNSWGRSCSGYPAPYDKQCEEGNIWVDEETIGKSLISVQYLY